MTENAGNPLGASPSGGSSHVPAPGIDVPVADKPSENSTQPTNDQAVLSRLVATVDQHSAEIDSQRKQLVSINRNLIMVLGVLALIAWNVRKLQDADPGVSLPS